MHEGATPTRSLGSEDFARRRPAMATRSSTMLIASLTALTLFVVVGIRRQAPLIEQDIRERATAAFADADLDWAQLVVDGRDLTVFGVAPSAAARSAAYGIAAGLEGVRLARNRTVLRVPRSGATAAPADRDASIPHLPYELVLQSDGAHLTLRGDVPDDVGTAQLVEQARRRFAVADVTDQLTRAPRNAPDQWAAAAGAALEALVLLEHGAARVDGTQLTLEGIAADTTLRARTRQELLRRAPSGFKSSTKIAIAAQPATTAADCQAEINGLLSSARIEFDGGSADLRADSTPVLEELVGIVQTCQMLRFEIAGYTDDRGDAQKNLALSQRRSEAVMEYLVQHGVALRRLAARGYGETQPVVRGTSSEARARNRRIEIHTEPTRS
jgi:outer membrane protein OmpA-like peptidoglycan-associated protein